MSTIGINPSPVRIRVNAISTSNLTLSGPQTADTVALTAGMLCGALGQSDNANGVYMVQSGTWLPVNPGFGTGLEVYAAGGSANVNAVYGCDTTGAIVWGTTSTAFTLKSAGATPGTGSFGVLQLTNNGSAATGKLAVDGFNNLGGISSYRAIRLWGENGNKLILGNSSTDGTSSTVVDVLSVSLADNGTFDYNIIGALGGHVTIIAPANSAGSIGGTVYFGADATTTLGGLTPTNLTATLTSANKINIGASGGAVRIENKTGGTRTILVVFHLMIAV